MDRVYLKSLAKQKLDGNWGTVIGAEILFSIIISAIGSSDFLIKFVNSMNDMRTYYSGIFSLISIILTGPMTVGLFCLYLEIVRKKQFDFSDMFSGFKNFGTNCGAGVLVTLFTFLWSLLLIIPGIVKSLSYSMTYYILADRPNLTAGQAIQESQRMMYGHKRELFELYLSYIGWYLLSVFTLGILLLYVVPYQRAAITEFYEMLKNNEEQGNTRTTNQPNNNTDGGPIVL